MALVTLKEYKHKRGSVAYLLATSPDLTTKQLAEKCGVSVSFISTLKKDTDFWELVEKDFKNHIANDFLDMDRAMIREAKEGNVQAYRAVNEKYGKFVKKFQLEVKSPYELFTNQEKEITSAEYEEIEEKKPLPDRNPINDTPKERENNEKTQLQSEIKKAKIKAENRNRAAIRRRARKAGLKLMPPGKQSPSKRKQWMKKLEKIEQSQREEQINSFTYIQATNNAPDTP